MEARFDQIKDHLREAVQTNAYPPAEAIEGFSKLIASEIEQKKH